MLLRYVIRTVRDMDVWIGANFETTDPHILILGESTYGSASRLETYIPDWLAGREKDQTFNRLTKGCTVSTKTFAAGMSAPALWHAIAFYNFIPGSIGATANAEPTSRQLKSGIRPLHLLLDLLRPDGVLICGKRHMDYSRPVVIAHGIPSVVITHPGRSSASPPITHGWDALVRVCE